MRLLGILKMKIRARIKEYEMGFFARLGCTTSRAVEYKFAISHIHGHRLRILDVGSVGSLFPLKLAKRGHSVYCIDWRPYHEQHPNLVFWKGDICDTPFPSNFFDVIACISTIEHVGLEAYGDPKHEEGEKLAINEMLRVIKPNGTLILTAPFSSKYKLFSHIKGPERIYDYPHLRKLLEQWKIEKIEYYIPINHRNWIRATRQEAEKERAAYANIICMVMRPQTKRAYI